MAMQNKADEAWANLFEKYDILNKIDKNNIFRISANQIREFREPRLMAKWDTRLSRPSLFLQNNINILPVSRSEYVLGRFDTFFDLPEFEPVINDVSPINIGDYQTIDLDSITSEANALNVMSLAHILDDFTETNGNVLTFSGRSSSNSFDFFVPDFLDRKIELSVQNAQIEVDAGFESAESVVIVEAKNTLNTDFNLRQLYYPMRRWDGRLTKPVRLVFSVYSNQIYRLHEFLFDNPHDMSSICHVKTKNYSLQSTNITEDDLISVYRVTDSIIDDRVLCQNVPFIQADDFDKVVSLLENLGSDGMTKGEIAQHFGIVVRQADYYANAGAYLGLFHISRGSLQAPSRVSLTDVGSRLLLKNFKHRQLSFVELMLQHEIFHMFFLEVLRTKQPPLKGRVEIAMRELGVCSENLLSRRSSSVIAWFRWILRLLEM